MAIKQALKPSDLIADLFLVLLGFTFLFPLAWMLLLSVKDSAEVFSNPFGLPRKWMFRNFIDVFGTFNVPLYFRNSIIYTAGTVLLTISLGAMFSYCIARMKWRFKTLALSYISLGMIIPVQVVIIPLFVLVKQLHIGNTFFGLILPYSAFGLPVCVLMFYAFFRTLPSELEEAAVLDGCSIYRCFVSIIMPMIKPAVSMQIVLQFMNTWNEFFIAYMLTNEERVRPLPIGLLNFFVGYGMNQWGLIGAAMVISSVPTIAVYLLFSDQVEDALTAGAILK